MVAVADGVLVPAPKPTERGTQRQRRRRQMTAFVSVFAPASGLASARRSAAELQGRQAAQTAMTRYRHCRLQPALARDVGALYVVAADAVCAADAMINAGASFPMQLPVYGLSC